MNGFFLGGMADSMESMRKQDLAERTLAQDVGLRTRAIDLQEKELARAAQQETITRAEKQVEATMGVVSETIKSAVAVGRDPELIRRAVEPLVASAKAIASRIGRDPSSLDAMVGAQLYQPTGTETARAAGVLKATTAIAEDETLQKAGVDALGKWKTLDEKVKAEGALRDDFLKQAQPFITMRDYRSNLDKIQADGAGDIALVFSFMKIIEPNSVVMPGEQANARNAGGVPGHLWGLYNTLLGGGSLSKDTRKQLREQALGLYESKAAGFDKLQTQFANIAKRQKLNVSNVVVDLMPSQDDDFNERFDGVTPNGTRYRVLPSKVPAPPPGFNVVQ